MHERERTSEGWLENRRGSMTGLDRAIQEVDEERHASDEVAKTSRRERARSRRLVRREVKSALKEEDWCQRRYYLRSLWKLTIQETQLAKTEGRVKGVGKGRMRKKDWPGSVCRTIKGRGLVAEAGCYLCRSQIEGANRNCFDASSSIERRRRATLFAFETREERIERASNRRRSSAVRARSQAKVDKGSPSRTVGLRRVGRGKGW